MEERANGNGSARGMRGKESEGEDGRDGKRIWHKPLCGKGRPCISAFAYEIAHGAGTLFGTRFRCRLFERKRI